ncbi:HAD-like domain-containing protein [Sphaerosporella brunnea]|uniref:HAD-like domain-containing protein n=1 Tax=Sphaerosporella brunnea TaxID=1250544 RepID=A0A5J5F6C5_9PEZI|nr:HAD-like domain-containing protein [Sphaerosporella brunnea]
MATKASPTGIKAVFFDIGGVCVQSPMLAIAEYEEALHMPAGYINYAISAAAPSGAWQRLERNEMSLDATFYSQFAKDIRRRPIWKRFHAEKGIQLLSYEAAPPKVDGEKLFWNMMAKGQVQDKVVMTAVKRLREAGVVVGALTNDYKYPDGHPYLKGKEELRTLFDVYVSSAETGLRKPEAGFYKEAMKRVELKEDEGSKVAFLDDIGTNLKTAKELGWRTVRVHIGRTREAVTELEGIVGLPLLEERSKL